MKAIVLMTLILTCRSSLFATNTLPDFKLIKSEDGVALYERWIRHNGNTVRELKIVFATFRVGVPELAALLKDASKGNKWNVKAAQYKIKNGENEYLWYNYIRYELPWPMNDQDCSLQFRASAGAGSITFSSVNNNSYPLQKNVTRIEGVRGQWLVERLRGDSSRVSYQIVTSKSGSVPRWVSDPIVYDNMITTISRFKRLLISNNASK